MVGKNSFGTKAYTASRTKKQFTPKLLAHDCMFNSRIKLYINVYCSFYAAYFQESGFTNEGDQAEKFIFKQ